MIAMQSLKQVKNHYLAFVKSVEPILFIRDEEHYHVALEILERLLTDVQDQENDKLNGLIDIISHAIETYEHRHPKLSNFLNQLDQNPHDVSLLRLLMDQHNLGVADLPEIGDKSLISKILSGERNLTKNHIKKLSERFSIDPGLFF